jgi:hypothetical protein
VQLVANGVRGGSYAVSDDDDDIVDDVYNPDDVIVGDECDICGGNVLCHGVDKQLGQEWIVMMENGQ